MPRIIEERDFSFKIIGDGQRQTVFNPLRKIGCRYLEIEGNAEVEDIAPEPEPEQEAPAAAPAQAQKAPNRIMKQKMGNPLLTSRINMQLLWGII